MLVFSSNGRLSVSQRVAVGLSSLLLLSMQKLPSVKQSSSISLWLLCPLCLLAGMEKLGSVLNTIAVERDWVVVIANGDDDRLTKLNSQMRRIDLFCKLVAPLAISFLDVASTQLAIVATAGMSCISVPIEYLTIAKVYHTVPSLSDPKQVTAARQTHWLQSLLNTWLKGLSAYVRHPVFLPSFALALLYMTVLSFSGQMITYLLAIGVSSGAIGILRGIAALSELSATWLAPLLMARIGPIRAGIWFLNWELLCVILACIFFWLPIAEPTLLAAGTVSAVIASRVGLWGYDLSAQILVQDEIEPDMRGTFSSQEFALQNGFEMLAFLSTIIFSRPEQFKYPATISAVAVAVAGVLYAAFVRTRRGHLVHLSRCLDGAHRKKPGWTAITQDEGDEEHELPALGPV